MPLERIPVRAIGLVASVALAYNYSLQTLARGIGLQTPLSYLALVPPIALLLGAANFKMQPNLRPIHDRQFDWIIGIFLIAIAVVVSVLLPSAYSADYWLHRIDMLGLPFFTAGLVALIYGVRRLWALRWAIAFLLLAWPDPYISVLASAIGASTDAALAVVSFSLHFLPVAKPLGTGTYLIDYHGTDFSLPVASALSGINSLVGFLILGGALNTIFRGSVWRRIAWMAAGLILVGLLNVVRIDLIFVAGSAFGESAARQVLHPVAGIMVFDIGAMAMFLMGPLFGLKIPQPLTEEPASDAQDESPAAPVKAKAPEHSGHARKPAYSIAVGLAVGAMLAVPNASFAHYQTLVDVFGSPTLGAIDPATVVVSGWHGSTPAPFGQASLYFGQNGSWERVSFSSTDPAAAVPSSVYLDVIRTNDSGSLGSYGIETCYNFHGYTQVSSSSADVGAGVDAKLASYQSPKGGTDWAVLWWEWPYNAGGQTRFERLVLLAPITTAGEPGGTTSIAEFESVQTTLTGLARQIVGQAIHHSVPSSDPGSTAVTLQ